MTTPALGLAELAEGSTAWYASYLETRRVMDALASPDNVFFVSPQFSDVNLGDEILSAIDRRHFTTIQAAIDEAQGGGYLGNNHVLVWPGLYNENLTISDAITIKGLFDPMYEVQGGGRATLICGVNTVQSPLVTIARQPGADISVYLQNLCFENSYNQTASAIDKAYFLNIDADDPSYGSYPAFVALNRCQVRAQTWGPTNAWQDGIRGLGWVRLFMKDTEIAAGRHAGYANNGGVARLIRVEGDNTATPSAKVSEVRVKRCDFYNDHNGPLSPAYFIVNKGVIGRVVDTSFGNSVLPLVNLGTGTNVVDGLLAGDINNGASAYRNTAGVNKTFMI